MKLNYSTILILLFMISTELMNAKTYTYETYPNDPLKARIYTLENGLKVYLTVYKDKPRIQTYIAVKAGSKFDPKETTGLAHYLEHMMFKGTPNYGSKDWAKEKELLDELSMLFEVHKNAATKEEKDALYKKIDSVSYEASKYAIPNEYDKMSSSIGAKGTNAYTSNDQTVYVNDIPSNEVEKWCILESERFQNLVLRLFHTELETVYEEFNRSQDNDMRWSMAKVWESLLPNHPYGTQTTIGLGEHLKNPSMVNIHNYFNTYYVPNNVAICMSGDLDPDSTIAWIDKYFGSWKPGKLPELHFDEAPKLTAPITRETYGPQAEHLFLGYLFAGRNTEDEKYLQMLDMMLSNGKTGLIDVNINQKQRTLEAGSSPQILNDYSFLLLSGKPKAGQTLEEVKDILLAEIEKLKKGEFTQEDMNAVLTNFKLQEIRSLENNASRANKFVRIFTGNTDYIKSLTFLDELGQIKKDDLVKYINEHIQNNYVVSYKRKGEDKERHKVDKPKITPVVLNRDVSSSFAQAFNQKNATEIQPQFLDFTKEIKTTTLNSGVKLEYINNQLNQTFGLTFLFEMGKDNDKDLNYAVEYLKLLGTDKYTIEQIKFELFKYGLDFNMTTENRALKITISGLEENMQQGLDLVEHIIHHAKVDANVYNEYANKIIKGRENLKTDKAFILQYLLTDRAKYDGNTIPSMDIYTSSQIRALDPVMLVEKMNNIFSYKHRIFYFGQLPLDEVKKLLDIAHKTPKTLKEYPAKVNYTYNKFTEPRVYFYNYDMVQAEIIFIAKDETYNKQNAPYITLLNDYFGSGLSSIVFQEIREQKALAYGSYCIMSTPGYADEPHFINAYIGTQADKVKDALPTLRGLMNDMPQIEKQFNNSKESALSQLETDRITRSDIFWTKEALKNRGIDYDLRKDNYEAIKNIDLQALDTFFEKHIKNNTYALLIIGNKDKIDMEFLKKYGAFKELTEKDLFVE
jgi:predicted Zn-dependent peptidase